MELAELYRDRRHLIKQFFHMLYHSSGYAYPRTSLFRYHTLCKHTGCVVFVRISTPSLIIYEYPQPFSIPPEQFYSFVSMIQHLYSMPYTHDIFCTCTSFLLLSMALEEQSILVIDPRESGPSVDGSSGQRSNAVCITCREKNNVIDNKV